MSNLITLDQILTASKYVWESSPCHKTPMVHGLELGLAANGFPVPSNANVSFKMESAQYGGCFKTRGSNYQLSKLSGSLAPNQALVTYSGGNYGKAFAMTCNRLKINSIVCMPPTAPKNRITVIEGYGSKVEIAETKNLKALVQKHVDDDNMVATDPFDDLNLIRAYGSIGLEIIDQMPEMPDVVLVPCGGGGLLSGIASSLRLKGYKNKIYGVEPVTSNVMQLSFAENKACQLPTARSVATGTCAPTAGQFTFPIAKEFVDDILLVNDQQIITALKVTSKLGFLVEPTGVVAVAALLKTELPFKLEGSRILVVISGSNVSLDDLQELLK